MSLSYTKQQREADELDLDMFRLVGRLRAFADTLPRTDQQRLHDAASSLSVARGPVRDQMHPERRRETSDA